MENKVSISKGFEKAWHRWYVCCEHLLKFDEQSKVRIWVNYEKCCVLVIAIQCSAVP